MKRTAILIALISTMAYGCYSETEGKLNGDAGLDTSPDGSGEICGNGVDDDGDTLADCGDPDCASECPDAPADVSPDSEDDSPAEEICDNGVDDDGDGFADCLDSDCPPCEDASTDAPEDTPSDTPADLPEDTTPDPEPDVVEDTTDDEVTTCTETPGEVTLTWSLTGHVYDDLRAECWVSGPADDWHPRWQDVVDWTSVPTAGLCTNSSDDDGDTLVDCQDTDGSEDCTSEPTCVADAVAMSTFTISYTLSYAPAMDAWCNFTAFDVVDGAITNQKYAVGMWSSGTYTEHGTLTASSGTCDVTSDVTVEYAGFGTACNYHITLP